MGKKAKAGSNRKNVGERLVNCYIYFSDVFTRLWKLFIKVSMLGMNLGEDEKFICLAVPFDDSRIDVGAKY